MSLKTIVVHVESGQVGETRLALAIRLAEEHGAHLVGAHPLGSLMVPAYPDSDPGLMVMMQELAEDERAKARASFKQAVETRGLSSEWRSSDSDVSEGLTIDGRYADLVIVGQNEPDQNRFGTPPNLAADLVFTLGRPLLVVPYIGAPEAFRRVLVAWNASREATRAVYDALPLLRRAELVTVLAINPTGGMDGHGDIPCADICLQLARHGVRAEADSLRADDIRVGDMLLSRAADGDAHLIVMGAYGHSRLREFVLGGVTRTLLQHMTIPVLFSH